MAGIGDFNPNEHDEMGNFDPVPAGDYRAQVVASDVKGTKSGTGYFAKMEWEILDGEFTGRKIFANYNLQNASEKAQEIGQREFASACRACGLSAVRDTEELHARPCIIKVRIQPGKDGYGPSNQIKGYSPASGAQPAQAATAQPAASATPQATAPAAQAAAPAPSGNKPPWA